ncbi:erythromycin esterase family protein [Amycolatopsis nigrescens]|uniref:erythromycin esterase family protein n=1 Tax=Amycolatopsis nigrescens TaxID=381445 RepID=UPI0003759E4C|nr:erythromycin esterase family protein [Amycolatopsis nigrescens]
MARIGFAEIHPLDGLEPLAAMIGDARIVAIGENNHHIKEFGEFRGRVLRFLVERLGFRVLGFESGFAEGALVDDWIRGGPGEVERVGRDGFTFTLGESPEMHEMLGWMRAHNEAGGDLRFAGLDLPSSAGSPAPALRAVRAYLSDVDPAAVSLVDRASAATEPYAAVSSAGSPAKYAALPEAGRHAATAALALLVAQLDALAPVYRPRAGAVAHAVARHHALGALRVDGYQREITELMDGTAPAVQGASRDTYMASTVRLLRELHGDARIVLMLHNGHLQRTPMSMTPGSSAPMAGAHLAEEFGADYFALGVTAGAGYTTGLTPDEQARLGFRVHEEELAAPAEGGVEHAMAGHGPSLLDLRAAKEDTGGPVGIRHAGLTSEVDVARAFDALAYFPESHVSALVADGAR